MTSGHASNSFYASIANQASFESGNLQGGPTARRSSPFAVHIKEPNMADDLHKRGSPDRDRINVNEEYELRDWSKSLGVSPEELKKAVAAVGDRAEAVRQHLGK